jgi:hypothetical protein
MDLPHGRRQTAFKTSEQVTKPAEGVTVGMHGTVFLPEQRQRHAWLLHLDRNHAPIWLRTAAKTLFDASAGEKPPFENVVGEICRQGPG